MTVWIDGDSCHHLAMERSFRFHRRPGTEVHVIADRDIAAARDAGVALTVLEHGSGAVDDQLVKNASEGDIAVTRDLGLAQRLLLKGVRVLNDQGRIWNEKDLKRRIEEASLMQAMRNGGMVRRGMPSYNRENAIVFSESLEKLISGG